MPTTSSLRPFLPRPARMVAAAVLAVFPLTAAAADVAWSGADGKWGDATNWSRPPADGDNAAIDSSRALRVTLDVDATLRRLALSGNGAISIAGDRTLTIANGGQIAKAKSARHANHTIAAPLHLSGSATFSNDGKWVRLANQLNIEGPISGNGTLTIRGEGDGSVSLRADNSATFRGTIVLSSGMLLVGHAGALGDLEHGTRLEGGMIMFERSTGSAEPITIAGKAAWDTMGRVELSGPITLESGAVWTLADDHANRLVLSGALHGAADSILSITTGNIHLAGDAPNTLAGTIRHQSNAPQAEHNALVLAKPSGVPAIAGPIELEKRAALTWRADDQIADSASLLLNGGALKPGDHTERLGVVTLTGRAEIDFRESKGPGGALAFADSSATSWKEGAQLLVVGWSGQRITFGDSATALTSAQTGMIGFRDPAGLPPGLYRATLHPDGTVRPNDQAVTPVDPPFEISVAADAERAALYEVEGLARLTGADTPLKAGMTISFFGDSITWQNNYISRIDKALNQSPATRDLKITLHNHGINGGGALQILEGTDKDAYGGGKQGPFAEVVAADKADVAVLFIGINDVWWRKTTPEDFRGQLTAITTAARQHGTRLVIATMAVQGEKPDGTNPNDAKIERYAQITREVAKEAGTPLVDLRKAFVAYSRNHNRELQLDGSIRSRAQGLLTTDGVHPSSRGNDLLANLIAEGIHQAMVRD